jgi:hypothetical protein
MSSRPIAMAPMAPALRAAAPTATAQGAPLAAGLLEGAGGADGAPGPGMAEELIRVDGLIPGDGNRHGTRAGWQNTSTVQQHHPWAANAGCGGAVGWAGSESTVGVDLWPRAHLVLTCSTGVAGGLPGPAVEDLCRCRAGGIGAGDGFGHRMLLVVGARLPAPYGTTV